MSKRGMVKLPNLSIFVIVKSSPQDVPAENKGLGKLPTSVRNKMGYKKDGGMTMKHTKKTKGYAKGGMKKPKMMGGGMNMKGKKTKGYARGGKR